VAVAHTPRRHAIPADPPVTILDRLARGLPDAVGDLVERRGSIYVRRRVASQAGSRCGLDAVRRHHGELCVLLARAELTRVQVLDDQWVLTFLAAHLVAEETVIYPALVRYDATRRMPLAVDEHDRLKRQILRLVITGRKSPQEIPTVMRELRLALLRHAQHDEHQLFEPAAAALGDHTRNTLGDTYAATFQRLAAIEHVDGILAAAMVARDPSAI
jgi:hypothetical protein